MKQFNKTCLLLGTICLVINLHSAEKENMNKKNNSIEIKNEFTTEAGQPEWAHLNSDIPVDERLTFGKLPNGLRYVILANKEPQNRVYFRMCVASGSFNETEEQRGLAHFLEHMVFNGSKNFPEGISKHFQRLGLEFGRDVNAYTSFESTVYRIDPPQNTPKYIRDSLILFRDYADGALLKDSDINAERGVILNEKREREDAQYASMISMFRFILPGTLVPERFPIGITKVISKAPAQRIRDYYYNYYSADRIMITVVGDIEPKEVEKMIIQQFSDLHSASRPNRNIGTVNPGNDLRIDYHIEKETQIPRISIISSKSKPVVSETTAIRAEQITTQIVMDMFDLRMDRLSKNPDAVFNGAGLSEISITNNYAFIASIIPKKDKRKESLQLLEQELRRVSLYGFTEEELTTVKAQVLSNYKKRVEQAPSIKSSDLADSIYNRYQRSIVISSPKTDLQIAEKVLNNLTTTQCLKIFNSLYNLPGKGIFITDNQEIKGGKQAIKDTYLQSIKVEVTPPKIIEQKPFAYQDFGVAGEIIYKNEIKDLGITQIKFANNVILNLKKTDFEKGRIILNIGVGEGLASLPKDKQGLDKLTESIFLAGGLQAHDIDELGRIFAGKSVDIDFKAETSSFNFGGTTTPSDLNDFLKLGTAYLTTPGFRPEPLKQYQHYLDIIYKQNLQNPMGVYKNEVMHYITGNDPRFGFPAQEKMAKYSYDDIKSWILPQLKKGAIEIGIVGDIDIDATVQAIAKTYGALPTRNPKTILSNEKNTLNSPWQDKEKSFFYNSQEPRGIVCAYWPTLRGDQYDVKKARRIGLLGEILNDYTHQNIREKAGLAYSPSAYGFLSRDYNHFGFMTIVAQVDPENNDKVLKMMEEIGQTLATKGFTEDEFLRVYKPRAFAIRDQLRQNSYWLNSVVTPSQSNPQVLDWCRDIQEDTINIKKEELLELAKEIFKSKPLKIKIIPQTESQNLNK